MEGGKKPIAKIQQQMIYPLRGSITECLHNTQAAHNFISSQSPFNLSLKAYQISINPSSLIRGNKFQLLVNSLYTHTKFSSNEFHFPS